jgi:thiamine biosynthesis lipoprotein ApbE
VSRTDVAADVHAQTTAMACEISVQARLGSGALSRAAVDDAVQVFHDVDRTCTRFDPASDLMRANADGTQWVRVHPYCFAALVEAHAAYRRTFGRFDPRVLDDLVRLG